MLSPADVFTCAFRTPVSGNSEGTSKLIWPLEDMTWNSGAAMPLKVTERPPNVVAGNKLVLSAVPMFETNTDANDPGTIGAFAAKLAPFTMEVTRGGAIDTGRMTALLALPAMVTTTSLLPVGESGGTVNVMRYVPIREISWVAGMPANNTGAGFPATVTEAGWEVRASVAATAPVAMAGFVGPTPVANTVI